MGTNTISFHVSGMSCSACATRLEKSLQKSENVISASVNFALETANLELHKITPLKKIQKWVRDAGFEVVTETHQFALPKECSQGEINSLMDALRDSQEIIDVSLSSSNSRLKVVYISHATSKNLILDIAHGKGIHLGLLDDSDNKTGISVNILRNEFIKVISAVILTLPFFLMMLFNHVGLQDLWSGLFPPLLQGVVATFILVVLGAGFFKGSYFALRQASANMEVLVVLGSSTACLFSWYQIITGEQTSHYFETTAFIITFVLIGKYLENRTKSKVADAITDLMALQPEEALLVMDGGHTRSLPASEIQVGDVLLCQAGQKIPVDGEVIKGSAEVDEAMISGESLPILKNIGSKVIAGSINCDGLIHIKAEAIGEEATLARLIRFIEEAHSRKARIYPLVDKVSNIFVPAVLVLSLVSLTSWLFSGVGFELALINAVSVLVIACPCALGLATPTAIMAGTSLAARKGILIRDSEMLQKARSLTYLVFDKTGTLTTGQPKIDKIYPLSPDHDSNQMIALAASLQQGSSHPIAKAIINEAQKLECSIEPVDKFQNHVGLGVEGELSNGKYLLGSSNLFTKFGFEVDTKQFNDTEPQVILGKLEQDKLNLLGGFSIHDEVRSQSSEAIQLLKDEGLEVMILSGDSEGAVGKVADLTGIKHYMAKADPVAKIHEIKELTDQGHLVGMVGDGINDSPALAHAHVGFAMGSGTDVAMNSSGIILMRSDPGLVAMAIRVSRLTFRKIKQNLFWAFIYNVVALPLAALGFLNPGLAAGAMALSSLSVVSNSLLLKFSRVR